MSVAEYATPDPPNGPAQHLRWYLLALADGVEGRDAVRELGATLASVIKGASEHELWQMRDVLAELILLRIPVDKVRALRSMIARALGEDEPTAPDPSDTLRPWSAPLGVEGQCRAPFEVDDEHGLYVHLTDDTRRHVLRIVPYPVARLIDAEGREWVRLAWQPSDPDATPVTADLRRSHAADPRSLVPALADRGVDIDARSGASVCGWISSAIAETPELPTHHLRERQGWVDEADPSRGFVLGAECVGGSAIYAGPEALAASYRQSGTLSGWIERVWAPIAEHPLVCAAVYASLSAALVPMLGVSSYALELAARTSKGKSTALYVAASVWGYPDGDRGQMMTWASSARGMSVHGAALVGMPLIADDTKDARSIEQVVSQVYAYAQPSRRVTSTADHRPDYQATMRGVMMLSGETPLADQVGGSEGAQARIVSICGAPWAVDGEAGAALVRGLGAAVRCQYGSLGRAWVQALVSMSDDDRAAMRADLASAQAELSAAGGIDGRIMVPVAVIRVAAMWAERLLGLECRDAAIQALHAEVTATRERTDLATRSARMLMEHYTRHAGQYRRSDTSQREPTQGWAGLVHHTHGIGWPGTMLRQILGDATDAAKAAIRDGIGWAVEQHPVTVRGTMRVYSLPIEYQMAYLECDPRALVSPVDDPPEYLDYEPDPMNPR